MTRLAGIVVALLLVGAIAHAEPPKPAAPPAEVAEVDWLRVQLAEANAVLAARTAQDAARAWEQAKADVRTKYQMSEADRIDPQTRRIARAPKPAKTTAK